MGLLQDAGKRAGDFLAEKDPSKALGGALGVSGFKQGKMYDVNKEAFYDTGALSERQRQLASEQAARAGQAVAPEAIAGQAGLAAALQAQMAGQGPSLAQNQLKQATDRNIAQAMAMAQTRGANPFLAQRQAMQSAATAGQEAAAQSGALRAQEQLAAQQQLAGVLQQQRGASLQEQQLRDQMAQFYAGQQTGLTQDQIKSKQAYEALMSGNVEAFNRSQQAAFESQQARQGSLVGGLIQGGGTAAMAAAMMSDKRVKKNVKDADFTELDNFVKMAEGGMVEPSDQNSFKDDLKKWSEAAKKYQSLSDDKNMTGPEKAGSGIGKGVGAGLIALTKDSGSGAGQAMAGESALSAAALANKGGYVAGCMAEGGVVPGKATVKGDSVKNDKVPALLSPGEAVIPRTVMDGDREKIQDFIDKLKAYQYEYKNAKHGEGKHTSVMAQDLMKSDLGSTAIIETPEGKAVDYGKLAAPMLAHQSMLSDKVKELEAALKLKRKGK